MIKVLDSKKKFPTDIWLTFNEFQRKESEAAAVDPDLGESVHAQNAQNIGKSYE